MTEKQDVYTRVTRKIIADLERGSLTWLQPWQAGHQAGPVSRPLRASGTPYRGVNVLMLWASAMENGYSNPLWLTYRQAKNLAPSGRTLLISVPDASPTASSHPQVCQC